MNRFLAILPLVSGTVALQVWAQAILLVSFRFVDHRMRGATELRPISFRFVDHRMRGATELRPTYDDANFRSSVLRRWGTAT